MRGSPEFQDVDGRAPGSGTAVRRRVLRPALLLIAGIFVLQVGWVFSLAPYYGIDEFDHAYRAASVARGHVAPGIEVAEDGRGRLILVPEDVVAAAFGACDGLDYTGPDNCTPVTETDAEGEVLVASAAATYNPVWYAVVGVAALPFDGDVAVLAMRWANVVLCDLLLLLAACLALSRTRSLWPLLGLVVVATPVVLYATATAAPNGLGFCAALAMWSSLLALARSGGREPGGPLAAYVGSAALVMSAHSTGALWVALAGLCCLPLLWPVLRELAVHHRRALTLAMGSLVVVAACCTAWVRLAGTNDPGDEGAGVGVAPTSLLVRGPVLWVFQSVATLRFRNNPAPVVVYALGVVLLLLLLVAAWRVARARLRWTVALVAIASTVVPLALSWATYDAVGEAWQGRYTLPLSCGFVLLLTHALGERVPVRPVLRRVLAGVAVIMQVLTMLAMYGYDDRRGTTTALLVVAAGLVALALLVAALKAASRGRDRCEPLDA